MPWMLPPRASVDDGVGLGGIQVAGGDHLRPAESHNRIPVGVRVRPIHQLDPFAVEVVAETHALAVVGFRGERAQRRRRRSRRGRAHPVLHVFMREDRSADGGIPDVAGHVAAGERTARCRQLLIAANVIGVRVGVDDVADWLGGRERIALDDDRRPRFGAPPERPPVGGRIKLSLQTLDGLEDRVGFVGRAAVDQEHAVRAHRHGDVAAGAEQHVNVAAHVQQLEPVGRLRCRAGGQPRQGDNDADQMFHLEDGFRFTEYYQSVTR